MTARRILLPTLALLALAVGAAARAQEARRPTFDFSGAFGAAAPTGDPVTLEARFGADESGGVLEITAKIAPSYHIYSTTQPAGGPGATVIEVAPSDAFRVAGAFVATPAPAAHIDHEIWEGLRIEEHSGSVVWRAPLEIAAGVAPEALAVAGVVSLQACQESTCEPLDLAFTATFDPLVSPLSELGDGQKAATSVVADGVGGGGAQAADAPWGGSMVKILGAAFLGGLILNLMPCVLPVIGLKVLSFAEQAGHHRGRVLAMNLAYSAGLIGVFLLLALLASLAQLGLANESFGWGELYTINEFKIGMIVLVFAMGLSFLGVWEIPLPGFAGAGKASDLQQQEGLSGAFFKGVFTTILATPCSGPFLGPVFGFTLTQPPSMTFLIFGSVGLGMASPYLLIGVFPSLVSWLPKPGAWMETFKQVMGFVLMGTVVYLFSTVASNLYLPAMTLLVGVGLACWWIGRVPMTASSPARSTAWIGGWAVAAAIGWVAFSMASYGGHDLPWKPYSSGALASAQQSGKTVLVDFTADWCLTCKLNLKRAINTERVKEVVESNGVTPLLADWTDRNDDIKATLESLGSRSIPLLAIYPAGRPDAPIILRDLISQEQLLEALREAGATSGNAGELALPTIEIGEAAFEGSLR